MLLRIFSFLLFVGLFAPGAAFALDLIAPPDDLFPYDAAKGSDAVKTDVHFKWREDNRADRYELRIVGVVQAVDNIEPSACFEGICSLWFLDNSLPTTIDPGSSYKWYVQVYDDEGGLLVTSAQWSFKTQQSVNIVPPPGSGVGGGSTVPLENPISSTSLTGVLENILNFLFGLAIVILPIIIIYSGILLIGAGGNPEKISKGRTILLWAVIAFAIILLARGLPTVLRNLL